MSWPVSALQPWQGKYYSVVARAAAARADALGLPFVCSSAVLDALTEQPTKWVARLASRGWQMYADFLLKAGHSRIAIIAQSSVYWTSGARILRDYLAPRGGTLIEVSETIVDARATALLLLLGYPDPAVSIVESVRRGPRFGEILIGAPAGPTRIPGIGDPVGRERYGCSTPALPSRTSHTTRCPSRGGPTRPAVRSAVVRRFRGLRHARSACSNATFTGLGSDTPGRLLAKRCR
jgi:hypothetical protein